MAQAGLNYEKNGGRKSRWTVPLRVWKREGRHRFRVWILWNSDEGDRFRVWILWNSDEGDRFECGFCGIVMRGIGLECGIVMGGIRRV